MNEKPKSRSAEQLAAEAEKALRWNEDPAAYEKYCKQGNIKVILSAIVEHAQQEKDKSLEVKPSPPSTLQSEETGQPPMVCKNCGDLTPPISPNSRNNG